jgi:nitroreductase
MRCVSKPAHPVLELIRRRASAESFATGREIDDELVRALVADACRAPSSFNIQHWRFLAVRREADKARLQAAAYGQALVGRAPVTFVILGDLRGAERLAEILEVAVERGALAAGKAAAWVAMAGAIYADPQLARDEAIRSCSLAAMTLMLAAEARGLVAAALTGFDPLLVRQSFAIPERYVPVMLLAVGHPEPSRPREPMPRLPVDEVLDFDRFDQRR